MTANRPPASVADWVQAIATAASAVIGLAAAYFALTTYVDSVSKQVDERKVQVMTLHQRFSTEPMLSIRKRIYGDIVRAQGCKWERDLAAPPSDQNDRFVFVEFFDVLDACVESRLCDADLAERLFAAYANGHWLELQGHIQAVRAGEAPMKLKVPFGVGLERFARNPQRIKC